MPEDAMLKIRKFVVPCPLHDICEGGSIMHATIEVPRSTQFISVSAESDHIVLWGLTESRTSDQITERRVIICPPETDITDDIALHYGGAVLAGGTQVHVFFENFIQHRLGPPKAN